jgi:hypothetical protein
VLDPTPSPSFGGVEAVDTVRREPTLTSSAVYFDTRVDLTRCNEQQLKVVLKFLRQAVGTLMRCVVSMTRRLIDPVLIMKSSAEQPSWPSSASYAALVAR